MGPTAAVFCNDLPDPYVLRVGSSYYAYSTNTAGFNVPVLTTEGLFGVSVGTTCCRSCRPGRRRAG